MARENRDFYVSNEWLVPIEEKARQVFKQLPRTTAVEVASAILTLEDSGDTEIPWTTVFPSDDIDDVCSRLLTTLRTPDLETPANNVELRPAINDLKGILFKEGALVDQPQACHAAYHLVRVAAGRMDENFDIYRDLARQWPQYAVGSTSWAAMLEVQFGQDRVEVTRVSNPELFDLLRQSQSLARLKSTSTFALEGETVGDFITRGLESLNVTDVASLEAAARLMARRHLPYREAAYRLRGLPEIAQLWI